MKKYLIPLIFFAQYNYALDFKTIPLPQDTETRTTLTNQVPYVFSGFSKESDIKILEAISQVLGKPTKTSTRFGRSTYYFETSEGEAKITLTKIGKGSQIDIMVTP